MRNHGQEFFECFWRIDTFSQMNCKSVEDGEVEFLSVLSLNFILLYTVLKILLCNVTKYLIDLHNESFY